jgi:two-component system, OmpR family, phosphate regulon sensor histidine kinase PhoR
MLNSFEKGPAGWRRLGAHSFIAERIMPAVEDSSQMIPSPPQGALTRLYVRRWLILLFAVIVLMLFAVYKLPFEAALLASLLFVGGTAVIPRSGLPLIPRPLAQARMRDTEPLDIATALIDGFPEPAIILSQDGTVLSFNGKARDLFAGLKAGSHLSSATRNPQILDAVSNHSPSALSQTVIFNERVPVERYMAATVSWFGSAGRQNPCTLLFIRDLTEQRRLDQLRSDFIANASHEIKTPLASLLGFIETLQGAARHDEGARDRFLTIMAKQAERMARLIDNLMSLSRVEMRAHLKPQDTVLIGELVEQACDALEPMAAEGNIKVTVTSDIGMATVRGDRDELLQVFINLLHNAIKYGRTGGLVHVAVCRRRDASKNMVEISIEDDGPGIATQHLPRLTERFYRVQTSAALEKGGTGLGLAIVKHVVNRHRGELRILSEVGAGSTFTVVLEEHSLPPELAIELAAGQQGLPHRS